MGGEENDMPEKMPEPFKKVEEFKIPFPSEELRVALARLKAHRATETNAEFTKRLREGSWPLNVDAAVANGDSK